MGLSRRKFTREFKIAALRQIDAGASIASVARSCEINPSLLHRWRRDFQQSPEQAFPGLGAKRADENRVAELERKIGRQALEIDFLKRCLQRIEEQRMLQALTGKPLSTNRSGKR
jgi:transposase-like protein